MLADGGEIPWGEEPLFRASVFVVTHRPRQTLVRRGVTSFAYVTDGIASAVEQARAAANGKNVAIAGATVWCARCSKAGLLDELELDIVPVVLGTGRRLLETDLDLAGKEAIELTMTRVVHTPNVTQLRYPVNVARRSYSTIAEAVRVSGQLRVGTRGNRVRALPGNDRCRLEK